MVGRAGGPGKTRRLRHNGRMSAPAGTPSDDYNQRIIDEFRAHGGVVQPGPNGRQRHLLLLTTTGAKTGRRRTAPLAYTRDGDHYVVIASRAGSPRHPDWFHNLVANPTVTVEVGAETFEARARVAEGKERERLYALQAEQMPQFAEYQQRTSRQIPVVVLERR